MVKVIGQDPGALKQVTCKHCAARLEYTQKDVKEYHGEDYGGGPDGKEWIDCPGCNREVTLRPWYLKSTLTK